MILAALLLAAVPPAAPPAAKAPPPVAAKAALDFDRTTKVDGPILQVVFGERAVFHLGDDGRPVLDATEKGQLAAAHPAGAVKESFARPEAGRLAIALDGSAEKKASYLKIWNGLDYPVIYKAGVLVLRGGVLEPSQVRVCAVPGGETHLETWPRPVVAVALGGFTKAASDTTCQ